MGYTTEFTGSLELSQQATVEQIKYINDFSDSRRMKRDVKKLNEIYQGEHGFNGEYGIEGEYFIGGGELMGVNRDESIIDHNEPPVTQPSLWCQWVLSDDGMRLEWDGSEKFYSYVEWLKYLIDHFFKKWGINLNGKIIWQGEDMEDRGKITVMDNTVVVKELE